MRDLSVLIKPCSSSCNMKCDYCFYNDLAQKRSISNYGIMKYDVLEHIVKSALKSAERSCVFAFQGGEPTLAGIEFYEKCLELQKKYGGDKHINNIIQTNGYALDENWCSFFAENQFLVGVSLDGNKSIHDKYRKTLNGLSTFERVISNIKLLQGQNVQFNILTVITKDLASCGGKIYSYYKKNSG